MTRPGQSEHDWLREKNVVTLASEMQAPNRSRTADVAPKPARRQPPARGGRPRAVGTRACKQSLKMKLAEATGPREGTEDTV